MAADDYYEILHVHPSASPEVIEASYRRLAALYDPIRNLSPDIAARLSRINAAYEVLRDSKRRATYDRGRSDSRASGRPPLEEQMVAIQKAQLDVMERHERRQRQRDVTAVTCGGILVVVGLIPFLLLLWAACTSSRP